MTTLFIESYLAVPGQIFISFTVFTRRVRRKRHLQGGPTSGKTIHSQTDTSRQANTNWLHL